MYSFQPALQRALNRLQPHAGIRLPDKNSAARSNNAIDNIIQDSRNTLIANDNNIVAILHKFHICQTLTKDKGVAFIYIKVFNDIDSRIYKKLIRSESTYQPVISEASIDHIISFSTI